MKTLITGGAGYIGATIASACVDAGISPVVLDDLSKGRREYAASHAFYEGDIADGVLIDSIFAEHPDISSVVHCAAKAVVPESVAQPLVYYRNNIAKAVDLLEHLDRNGCRRLIFSSSASIYRPGPDYTVDETSEIDAQSPYAKTKWILEEILEDVTVTGALTALSLRYFNPIGADPQLRTGLQDPAPTHAMGKLIEAHATRSAFHVTGVDWPTRDGSGIRDYIHVWDLAQAHVAALTAFDRLFTEGSRYQVLNLGTGRGTTVKELVNAFETVTGEPLQVVESPARPGDSVGCFTRTDRARELLGWSSLLTIEDGVRHSLQWAAKRASVLG